MCLNLSVAVCVIFLLVLSSGQSTFRTLSVLETSLPMQRSHDIIASGISAKNGCLGW